MLNHWGSSPDILEVQAGGVGFRRGERGAGSARGSGSGSPQPSSSHEQRPDKYTLKKWIQTLANERRHWAAFFQCLF